MHKLNQPAVIVKAREVDVGIVQGVLDGARSRFKQAYGSDAPSITMAEDYLPGPPSGGFSLTKLITDVRHRRRAYLSIKPSSRSLWSAMPGCMVQSTRHSSCF